MVIVAAALVAGAVGAVQGVNAFLGPDDLKDCPQPSLLNPVCAPADAIVTLSGGDTPARVTEAIRLYKAGWARQLVFSGAALDKTGPSNAEAMRRQAVAAGVPQEAILIDVMAFDTAQNALNTSALLAGTDRVIVVTSAYHQRRAGLEFKRFLGERVTVLNHPTPYDRLWPEYWWTNWDGWWLALTESAKTLIVMTKL
ncbi:MAG TPA: YdcF family protein [Candidatus Saccharimonadales bacterium]|nr:YdcF family protein [Candidatus Saccharimonadales bacterium]